MNIQTEVVIDRDWANEFAKEDSVIEMRVAIHISIDPITGIKSTVIYTDDGRGNGTPILISQTMFCARLKIYVL